MCNETQTLTQKDIQQVASGQIEVTKLIGLMYELGAENTPFGLFDRFSNPVDAINDTEDDYVPTDEQVQAVVSLQAEVKAVINSLSK